MTGRANEPALARVNELILDLRDMAEHLATGGMFATWNDPMALKELIIQADWLKTTATLALARRENQ